MAQKKKQLMAEGKLDKHGRPNENTPKEYLHPLPAVTPPKVSLLGPCCDHNYCVVLISNGRRHSSFGILGNVSLCHNLLVSKNSNPMDVFGLVVVT